jgi:hypothetical protein
MAIAFDAMSGGALFSTSWSHTIAAGGSLFVGAFDDTGGSNLLTAVKWNTTESLAKIAEVQCPGDRWVSLWWILAPTATTANISLTTTAGAMKGSAISLTGVGAADVNGTATSTVGSPTAVSKAITVGSNAWIVSVIKENSSDAVSWTNATSRATTVGSGLFMADSNAALTGSQTTTGTAVGSGYALGLVVASFTPSGGGGATTWGPWVVGNNWNRLVQ